MENPIIASAALPASGAWTAATPIALNAGTRRLGLSIAYTGGSSTGQVKLRVRKGLTSAAMGVEQVVDQTLTVASSVASAKAYDMTILRPVTGTTAGRFALDIDVAGWPYVAVDLAEAGDTANPGTASLDVAPTH